jgi:prepilin-type processing-associated H-X9-DG protein
VIAIITTLTGLLLPAVQKVREAAARTKCQNNLKQIGLAFTMHHDTLKAYPGGGGIAESSRTMTAGRPATYATQAWSWAYQILPYIEQNNLWADPSDSVVRGTPVGLYFCPSRRPPTVYNYDTYGPCAQTDYAGNAGSSTDVGATKEAPGFGRSGVVRKLGQGAVKVTTIKDGTSNTVVVGEKRMNATLAGQQFSADDNEGYVAGFQHDTIRWALLAPAADYSNADYPPTDLQPTYQFGSAHPGAAQFAFADGSVRPVRYSVSLSTFQNICDVKDGNVVSLDDL